MRPASAQRGQDVLGALSARWKHLQAKQLCRVPVSDFLGLGTSPLEQHSFLHHELCVGSDYWVMLRPERS